jgi:hypothetical protein
LHALHPSEGPTENIGIHIVESESTDNPIPFPERRSAKEIKTNRGKLKAIKSSLNDLSAFREKHIHLDQKIKELAVHELNTIRAEKKSLTTDEELLLQILAQHHQPRKQLMIALRSNLIYPNLKYFLDTAKSFAEIKDNQ